MSSLDDEMTKQLTRHLNEITRVRIETPDLSKALAQNRERRAALTGDGRLNIIAADHPARGVVQAGAKPMAMANRHDYLKRIAEILIADAADGIMATMDILEELIILSHLIQESGGKSFVDQKLLIASLNRGGLARTAWQLDDPVTGANPRTCSDWNLDGAKMMLRIDDQDANSLKTMMYCTDAINHLLYLELPLFLEPLPVVREDGVLKVKKDAQSLALIAGVASALGESSSRLWLTLPHCENFETVAQSTTLPILLTGDETQDDENALLKEIKSALSKSSNVCGTMIGGNVLYATKHTHIAMAQEINELVHVTHIDLSV